jgi:hypothetical protein
MREACIEERMTTIDPRSPLFAAVRAQIAAARERVGPRKAERAGRASASSPLAGPSGALAQRIRALDRADPHVGEHAVRLYLESELAGEFGEALLRDPAFPEMVDAVHSRMRADPEIAAASESLGRWLVEQHPP